VGIGTAVSSPLATVVVHSAAVVEDQAAIVVDQATIVLA